MGLVIVALTARIGGYDALPDPLGWLLVVNGLRGLPDDYRQRSTMVRLALLVLAVSVLLWVPATGTWLDDHDASLRWAVNLPQALVLAWFAHTLAGRAAATDPRAGHWLRTTATLVAATAVAPVLVFGGGVEALEAPSYVLAAGALLLLIWLLFAYSARAWATPEPGHKPEQRNGPPPPRG